jgi:hypothetical protein
MAVGLLAIATLSLIAVFIGGLQLMSRSEERTAASNLGSAVLESISDIGGFHAVPNSDSLFDGARSDPAINNFPPSPYPAAEGFTIAVETRVVTARTRAVQVTVSWDEGRVKLEKIYNEVE